MELPEASGNYRLGNLAKPFDGYLQFFPPFRWGSILESAVFLSHACMHVRAPCKLVSGVQVDVTAKIPDSRKNKVSSDVL